jgi:hypothetical protein
MNPDGLLGRGTQTPVGAPHPDGNSLAVIRLT